MDTDDLKQRILHIKRIARTPDKDIEIMLLEVRSVTVALTQTIARRFQDISDNYLLILTKDYETLDLVLLDPIVIRKADVQGNLH